MKKINEIRIKRIPEPDSDLSYLGNFSDEKGKFAIKHSENSGEYKYFNAENVVDMEEAKQNYDEIMQYEKGDLLDYGVVAEAEILTSDNGNNWLINKISSSGIWGLQNTISEQDFIVEENSQFTELKDVLKEFGFTEKEINSAKIIRKRFEF